MGVVKNSITLFQIILFWSAALMWSQQPDSVRLHVLGNVQDGGVPHIGCQKSCCVDISPEKRAARLVTALGLFLDTEKTHYLFEATPDISDQWNGLRMHAISGSVLSGIFLTHAHIGHYSGLQFLGKEALGAQGIPVFAMPRMYNFLATNGPWSQLVDDGNIVLRELYHQKPQVLSKNVVVTPIQVPHRDEYSETVGYFIKGPNKTALFLPDIDKWERWEVPLESVLEKVDYAFIDATFFDAAEINYRDISAIPHPFVIETLSRLSDLSISERKKVFFIHLNHTNPLLDEESPATQSVLSSGMQVARKGMFFSL